MFLSRRKTGGSGRTTSFTSAPTTHYGLCPLRALASGDSLFHVVQACSSPGIAASKINLKGLQLDCSHQLHTLSVGGWVGALATRRAVLFGAFLPRAGSKSHELFHVHARTWPPPLDAQRFVKTFGLRSNDLLLKRSMWRHLLWTICPVMALAETLTREHGLEPFDETRGVIHEVRGDGWVIVPEAH